MASQSGRAPRLSIVIPAADTEALEETLVSVLENRPADCEIIAVLAVAYADPWSIGEEVRFVQAPPRATLVDCVNLGAAAAGGEFVHVLAAGWRATEGWAEAAVARFDQADVAAVVPLTVSADDRGRVVAAGIRRTAGGRSLTVPPARGSERVEGDGFRADGGEPASPLLEAGFWRAECLAGGFPKACGDRLAAADMAALVSCSGWSVAIESGCHVVEGPQPSPNSAFLDGMRAERLFWRSLAAEPLLTALAAHGVEVVRHAVATAPLGTVPMLAGRLATLMQFGSCLARTRELEAAKSRAAEIARQRSEEMAGRTLRIDAGHALPGRPRRASGGASDAAGTPAANGAGGPPLRRSA